MVLLIATTIAAQDDEATGDAPMRMMPNKLPDPVHEGGMHLLAQPFKATGRR